MDTTVLILDGFVIAAFVYTFASIVNHVEDTKKLQREEDKERSRLRRLADLYGKGEG